jgi:endoplasmic reticulum junction formation protein lunapark
MADDGWGWLISVYRIYGVRTASAGLFDHRISTTQQQLETLNKQRQETIEKLKIATKYNSTQQLLEKYGAESPKPAPKNGKATQKKETGNKTKGAQTGSRTGFVPPPTANIQRPQAEPLPSTPRRSPQSMGSSPQSPTFTGHDSTSPLSFIEEPGFAPNAFPTPPQYVEQPRWYDRLLDVLMGEDETLPKNRLALICGNCRLVNGLAPPGTKDLETLGRWRCGACGAWNGVESKAKKALANISPPSPSNDGVREPVSKTNDEASSAGDAADDVVIIAASEDDNPGSRGSEEGDQSELFESEPQPPPKPKRGRPKKSKKKA